MLFDEFNTPEKKDLLFLRKYGNIYLAVQKNPYAPVAQLDRVSDYESEGREFESLPARHRKRVSANGTYPFSISPMQCRY